MSFTKSVVSFALLTFIGFSSISCTTTQHSLKTKELVADGNNVRAELYLKLPSKNGECSDSEKWIWGTENLCPRNIVSGLKVTYKNSSVFIPVSAYADIGNVSHISIINNRNHDYSILIKGGDAAFSYKLTLDFNEDNLKQRIVRHDEFPEESWEKTEYKFNY